MYEFEYTKANSVDDAVEKLKGSEDGKVMAGGMTLIPTLKQRLAMPSDLIDLASVDNLAGISTDGSTVTIGAMTHHADVAASDDVKKAIAALAVLAGGIGDPAVRHRGTIGGSIANSDPSADYPAGVLGLNATVVTNEREIAADDFFLDLFETALNEQEIITAVRFPIPDRAGYIKFPNPASGYAVVGVMVAKFGDDVRVAVTGAGASAFRIPEMEAALAANFSAGAVANISIPADDLNADIHASAEYRAHLVTVMAKRAVALA
ncbi:MAG: xanthine dehydrogenase family protein subunit M [Rhodospirillaceae bacterium]|jgi:carbon-monoxide dehydrogenase medium subunit|nr:xanthine dehydrogenase family protein subunit M [Rhodospirillales bacterium]MBT3905247.1 xanthine dehydrogenase family protein subunit M [Rhodospirillaceae bacterium]MBT5035876.1 xanthine dehydrogenase family protein subunit M [Rhodospirillaceae bacterium]MBT6222161.1 xanthine dehydrogenase family protein subunit M [Rhodospirillaceae bacterium]MBT6364345.1 xanthine dehydrogenase family protein subunit M [Rhodospirillaceae bacterium]